MGAHVAQLYKANWRDSSLTKCAGQLPSRYSSRQAYNSKQISRPHGSRDLCVHSCEQKWASGRMEFRGSGETNVSGFFGSAGVTSDARSGFGRHSEFSDSRSGTALQRPDSCRYSLVDHHAGFLDRHRRHARLDLSRHRGLHRLLLRERPPGKSLRSPSAKLSGASCDA